MVQKKRVFLKTREYYWELSIIAIIAVVSFINPKFIAVKNMITILQQISVTGILTMAMSILLIGGGVDLSIGNLMVLAGVSMAELISLGYSVPVAVLAGIAVGIVGGLLNGVIIARSKCIPLIITLGTSQVFYGLALTISGGRIMSFDGAFNFIGKTKIGGIFPVMLFVLAIVIAVSYIIMNYTKFGRRLTCIGGNEKTAFLSGINVVRYKTIMYGIAGLYCAIAAIVFSSRIDSITANAGSGYETNALTAAIIGGVTFDGGKGTITGAFLGCILMGVISNAMNILKVETYVQTILLVLLLFVRLYLVL